MLCCTHAPVVKLAKEAEKKPPNSNKKKPKLLDHRSYGALLMALLARFSGCQLFVRSLYNCDMFIGQL